MVVVVVVTGLVVVEKDDGMVPLLVVDPVTGPTDVAVEFEEAVLELTSVLELEDGVAVRVCVMTTVELIYSVDVE